MSRTQPPNGADCLAFIVFVNSKYPDRSLILCDEFTRQQHNHHLLEEGQAYFRLYNDNSKTEPIVMLDIHKQKIHFLRDYDDESSAWDRGQKIKRITYIQQDLFLTQFDSVENILKRE